MILGGGGHPGAVTPAGARPPRPEYADSQFPTITIPNNKGCPSSDEAGHPIIESPSVAGDSALFVRQLRFHPTAARVLNFVLDFQQQRAPLVGLAVIILLIVGKKRLSARREVNQSRIALLAQFFCELGQTLASAC